MKGDLPPEKQPGIRGGGLAGISPLLAEETKLANALGNKICLATSVFPSKYQPPTKDLFCHTDGHHKDEECPTLIIHRIYLERYEVME